MINKIIKLYCLCLPLNVFTIEVGGYPLGIPMLMVITLTLALILYNRPLYKNIFLTLISFLTFALITTLMNHGITKFVLSLGLLSCLALPLCFKLRKDDVIGFEKYLIAGFLLTIPFSMYDLGVTLLGFTPTEEISEFFSTSTNSPLYSYLGFYRIKSTFTEPSYFGIYLVSIFYITTQLEIKNKQKFQLLLLLFIGLTVSLTAFILIGFVIVIYLFKKKLFAYKYLVALFLVLLALPSLTTIIIERLIETVTSLEQGDLSGSEGSRINSLSVMFQYLAEQNPIKLLIGEGYSYYSEWLIDRFSGYPLIGYSRGQIFNAFAVIGISLGVIGLILYTIFFFSLAGSNDFKFYEILFHFIIQFSLAFFVGYLFWSVLMLIKFKNIIKRDG